MEREKQIEEISNIVTDTTVFDDLGNCTRFDEDEVAEAIYNAGYRKQSEGEWKEVDDGVSIGDGKHLECSECGVWKKDRQRSNYCPNCGVRMKGGEE